MNWNDQLTYQANSVGELLQQLNSAIIVCLVIQNPKAIHMHIVGILWEGPMHLALGLGIFSGRIFQLINPLLQMSCSQMLKITFESI